MSKPNGSAAKPVPTTPGAASRVQGAIARGNGGGVPKASYVGRLQVRAARNFGRPGGK